MTLWSMFKEKTNNFFSFVTPERKERRDALQVMRIEEKVPFFEEKERHAEEQGDIKGVEQYLEKIREMEEKAAFKDFDELVQTRLLLGHQLHLYNYIIDAVERDLRADTQLTPEQKYKIKDGVVTRLQDAYKELMQIITVMFRQETSFASINVSLRNMLKTDTVAKDVYSFYRTAKRAAKNVNSAEKKILKDSRNSKEIGSEQFLKRVNAFAQYMKAEKESLLEAGRGTLILLQRDKGNLEKTEHHIKELMENAGFPKSIGSELVKKYDETLLRINKTMHEEIAKKRIELNNVQRVA